jgi:hypothetical protein
VDSVASPDARPVHGCQVLRWGLARTKEAKEIYYPASPVLSPMTAASSRHFSAPANSAASSPDRRLNTCSVSLQQPERTYLGRGMTKTTLAPPTKANIFSICFKQFLKAEGGGQAGGHHKDGIVHPRLISQREWASHLRPYLGRRNSTSNRLQPCQFPF